MTSHQNGIAQRIKVKGYRKPLVISKLHEGKEPKDIKECEICKYLKKTSDKEIVRQLYVFITELHQIINEKRSQDIIDHLLEILEGEYC